MQHAPNEGAHSPEDNMDAKPSARPKRRGAHSKPLPEKSEGPTQETVSPESNDAPEARIDKPSAASVAQAEDNAVHKEPKRRRSTVTGAHGASHHASTDEQRASGSHESQEISMTDKGYVIPSDMGSLEPESPVDTSVGAQSINQRQVFRENPRIFYMNGESLLRPMTLPHSAKIGVAVIVSIAIIISAVLFFLYYDNVANEPAREKEKIDQALSKDASLDLPEMLSLLELDDAEIDAALKEGGSTFFERSPVGAAEEYEIIKLPEGVTLAEAALMYANGISKLSAAEAATLLNGSWDLEIDRSNGLNMSVHYADFKSGTLENAISNAISAERLERGHVTDSGDNDGYGNHYSTGTIMINGEKYTWTVSALPLSKVYSLPGLPDNAAYVGIRIKGSPEE